MPMRVAVAVRCFQQPWKQSIRSAAQIGATGLQFDVRNELRPTDLSETGRRQFLHYLDEYQLTLSSFSFPNRRAIIHPERLDARIAAIKEAMSFAFSLKARILTMRAGAIPSDFESTQFQMFCELLNDLARHGNRVGTTLALTTSGESEATLARVLESVTDGPIGIDLDPATYVIHGESPIATLRAFPSRLAHVRIRDAVREIDGRGSEVPVGRGEVEWDELLATIEEAGYRGWLTIDRTEGDDRAGDAARAVQFLQNIAPH